jgi:hypothetical protein
VGSATNSLASLTLSSDSAINLGSGQLTFSSQTAADWSGRLTLTGTLGSNSLRFQPPLSAAQLESVRYEGKRVMQSSGGYLVPWQGTLIFAF